MSSDDLARLARDLDHKQSVHIGFLALKAEDDPLWGRKLADAIEVRAGIRAIIVGADAGIGPEPYAFRLDGLVLNPPVVADAATDDDDGDWEPMGGEGDSEVAEMARAWQGPGEAGR